MPLFDFVVIGFLQAISVLSIYINIYNIWCNFSSFHVSNDNKLVLSLMEIKEKNFLSGLRNIRIV